MGNVTQPGVFVHVIYSHLSRTHGMTLGIEDSRAEIKCQKFCIYDPCSKMREMPLVSRSSDKILLVVSVGWKPSQNTYSDAFAHVPTDFGLHKIDVSNKPVPQHALLASAKPVKVTNLCIFAWGGHFLNRKVYALIIWNRNFHVPLSEGFWTMS